MNKKENKKLALKAETLRYLTERQLKEAAGGAVPAPCTGAYTSCHIRCCFTYTQNDTIHDTCA